MELLRGSSAPPMVAPSTPPGVERMSRGFGNAGAFPWDKWKEAGKAFLGIDEPAAPPKPPGLADILGGPLYSSVLEPSIEASNRGIETAKQPGFGNKVKGAAEYAVGGIPLAGPQIVNAMESKTMPQMLGRTAQAALPLALGGEEPGPRMTTGGDVETIGTTPRALASKEGQANLVQAMKPPARPGNAAVKSLQQDVGATARDISQMARENPLQIQRPLTHLLRQKPTPDNVFEMAGNFDKAANQLEQTNVFPALQKYGHLPVNMQTVREAGLNALRRTGADPNGERAAENWITSLSDRNISEAVKLREDLNRLTENKFGKLSAPEVEVQKAVVRELRTQIDAALESTGTPGIKESNRRIGALRAQADRLEQLGQQFTNKEAVQGNAPRSIRPYLFAGPGHMSFGVSVNPREMMRPDEIGALTNAYRQLGKAGMTGEEYQPGLPRLGPAPEPNVSGPKGNPTPFQPLTEKTSVAPFAPPGTKSSEKIPPLSAAREKTAPAKRGR